MGTHVCHCLAVAEHTHVEPFSCEGSADNRTQVSSPPCYQYTHLFLTLGEGVDKGICSQSYRQHGDGILKISGAQPSHSQGSQRRSYYRAYARGCCQRPQDIACNEKITEEAHYADHALGDGGEAYRV